MCLFKKCNTDLCESKICCQTCYEKKFYHEKLWLAIYWPWNQNRANLMIQDGKNIFGFYSSKNDAAVNNLKEDKSEYLLACWLSIVL